MTRRCKDCKLKKEVIRLQNELFNLLAEKEFDTGLIDTVGNKIRVGDVVHWTDGGDDLPLKERIETRWDRIAVVYKEGPEVVFKVFDSPSINTRENKPQFNYGNFIYKETEKYLTVVAHGKEDYFDKFQNVAECMAYVLEIRKKHEEEKQ